MIVVHNVCDVQMLYQFKLALWTYTAYFNINRVSLGYIASILALISWA